MSPKMKRTFFPYLLGSFLILATLGTAVIGYLAYQNLEKIITTLDNENKPQYDLILINKVSRELDRMEHSTERYVFSNNSKYLADFEENISNAITDLDSLGKRTTDSTAVILIDSLKDLILIKSTVLKQVAHLDYHSVSRYVNNLKIELDEPDGDSLDARKKNFLSSLFGKNSNNKMVDSSTFITKADYQAQVEDQLEDLAKNAQKKEYNQKFREFSLRRDHDEVNSKILSIIAEIEAWEFERISTETSKAQDRAEYTNKYVTLFGLMVPVMLLVTLTVLVLYTVRTKKYQLTLNQSRKNALSLAREKEQFLANMSHELRTPMNAIAGFSRLLLDTKLSDEQREKVSIIEKSSDHLSHILNDVLDYSKIRAGHLKLDKKPFNPSEIIEQAINLLKHRAGEKGLKINNKSGDLPKTLNGDPYRVSQILLNLITNSIKFTEQGEITVKATSKTQSDGKINLILKVSDTGIGIPKSKQKHIFKDFAQVEQELANKGTGLGLAIVNNLVIIHQGKIRVQSEPGEGSTFTVTLPFEVLDDKKILQSDSPKPIPNLGGMHALIADDELFNRKLLVAILEKRNVTYDLAEDGQQAYDLLLEKKFDVILLDFKMPKMHGLEVIERVRTENGINHDTPIIGLTATVSDSDLQKARKAGMDRILRKPFEETELLRLMAVEAEPNPQNSATPDYSVEGLKSMGDQSLTIDLIATYIDSTTDNINELNQHAWNKNWEECADVLHKILGPTRHFRADKLVDLMKQTELSARSGAPIPPEKLQEITEQTNALLDALRLDLQQIEGK